MAPDGRSSAFDSAAGDMTGNKVDPRPIIESLQQEAKALRRALNAANERYNVLYEAKTEQYYMQVHAEATQDARAEVYRELGKERGEHRRLVDAAKRLDALRVNTIACLMREFGASFEQAASAVERIEVEQWETPAELTRAPATRVVNAGSPGLGKRR